jgi:general secretion pathway protein H
MKNNDGFTLAEMLVVLAIMALLAVFAMPMAQNRSRGDAIATAAQTLVTGLREARLAAIGSNQESKLEIDLVRKTLAVNGKVSGDTLPDTAKIEITSARETVNSGTAVFRFSPSGASSGGEIRLTDSNKRQVTVYVSWLTGAITFSQGVVK